MKKDIFLKVVLTIIAVNLSILTLIRIEIIPDVHASKNPVIHQDQKYGLIPLNKEGAVNVSLNSNDVIDVNIQSIESWDNLGVDIESINTRDNLGINIQKIDTWDKLGVEIKNTPLDVKSQ
ncbi:MAG: hypothetical protein R6U19_07045 [Bacteroidales bacterium]